MRVGRLGATARRVGRVIAGQAQGQEHDRQAERDERGGSQGSLAQRHATPSRRGSPTDSGPIMARLPSAEGAVDGLTPTLPTGSEAVHRPPTDRPGSPRACGFRGEVARGRGGPCSFSRLGKIDRRRFAARLPSRPPPGRLHAAAGRRSRRAGTAAGTDERSGRIGRTGPAVPNPCTRGHTIAD